MKLVSWNVNGLRACLGKGFLTFCGIVDADVICLQETKMRPEQAEFELPGYTRYWNSADKKGAFTFDVSGSVSSALIRIRTL